MQLFTWTTGSNGSSEMSGWDTNNLNEGSKFVSAYLFDYFFIFIIFELLSNSLIKSYSSLPYMVIWLKTWDNSYAIV